MSLRSVCLLVLLAVCAGAAPESRAQRTFDARLQDSIPVLLPPNSLIESRVIALTSSFTLPIIRFNLHKNLDSSSDHSLGSVSLFNSIGAGVNLNIGRLYENTDGNSKVINAELQNAYGVQVGFLFAANTEDGNRQDVFALTGGVNILNFQFGGGYEFGHVVANQRRGFFTLAYSIHVDKLVRGGIYILKSSSKYHTKPFFPI